LKRTSANKYPSIFIGAAISFILIAVFGTLLLNTITTRLLGDLAEHFAEDQSTLSELVGARIEDFFGDIEHELIVAARRPGIRDISKKSGRAEMIDLADLLRDKASSVSRMDSLGVLRLVWPDTGAIGQSIAYQKHVRKTLADHKAVISPPILTVQGFLAIVIHEPVFDEDSVWLGNICALVPFENIEKKLLSELGRIGADGFICDSTGEILYHPDLAPGTMLQRAFPIDSSAVLKRLLKALPGDFSGAGRFVDNTGKRKSIGITTVTLGDYHWHIGIYKGSNALFAGMKAFEKKLYLSFGMFLLALAASLIYVSLSARRRELREVELAGIEASREKGRIDDLASKGLHAFVTLENEKESLQTMVKNILEMGGFSYIGLFRRRATLKYVLGAQTFSGSVEFDHFEGLSESDSIDLHASAGLDHPFVQSLMAGETVDAFSMNQLETFNASLARFGRAHSKIFSSSDISIIPVKAKGELLGILVCCVPKGSSARINRIEPFIDQIAQVLEMSNIVRQLRDANALYMDVFQNVGYGIHIVDSELRLLSFNNVLEREFGLGQGDIGRRMGDVFPAEGNDLEQAYAEVFKTGLGKTTEETTFGKDRETRYVRTKLVPMFSPEGGVQRVMTIIEDVTERRRMSAKLEETLREMKKLASTDGLTRLYNYRYFSENIARFMDMAREANTSLCLIILDIDNLKGLNDEFGHQYGDGILRRVAGIIEEHQSPGDIAARYGGDEFVIVLRNMGMEGAVSRAEVIRANIADKAGGPKEAVVTASLGVAMMSEDMATKDDLIRCADRALYLAKEEGRNLVRVWKAMDDKPL